MYEPQLSDFVRFWCILYDFLYTEGANSWSLEVGLRFGVQHATQLMGHAASLLYFVFYYGTENASKTFKQ